MVLRDAGSTGRAIFIMTRIGEGMEEGRGLEIAGMSVGSARADAAAGKSCRNWISKGGG